MEYIDADTLKPETPVDGRKFIVIPYRALKDPHMQIGRLRVLMALCSYARPDGSVWPSVKRIAEDCGYTQSTVSQHITALTASGYLKTINNSYTVGKRAKPRRIIFDPDQIPSDEDFTPEERKPIEHKAQQVEPNQSIAEPLADPTSLFVVWRKHMQEHYSITPPFEEALYRRLSTRYTVERFEEAARVFLSASTAPPPSVGVLLRS